MDDVNLVFNYLPLRRNVIEEKYLDHIWQSFGALERGGGVAQPFSVMPFHLLFMLAVQYKILRISNAYKKTSNLIFSVIGGRNKSKLLSGTRSVFDIALINERTMSEIFQLIGLNSSCIKTFKMLVDERNDHLAHAKGGIESKLEEKIYAYLEVLDKIQECSSLLNNKLAKSWDKELTPDDDINEFVEVRLKDNYLCIEDFRSGLLKRYNIFDETE